MIFGNPAPSKGRLGGVIDPLLISSLARGRPGG
jgi:hypothetical protein